MVKRGAEETNGNSKRARTGRSPVRSAGSRAASRASSVASNRSVGRRERPIITPIPTVPQEKLNVYVFGSGSICELGLGPKVIEVKRPRLNPLLSKDDVGVTALAVGGAHVLAIDHNGKVWSWGPNDTGNLGRNSKEPELADDESEDEDKLLNGLESSPGLVEGLPPNAKFVGVGATDSLSAAITTDGHVYAWGSFNDEGDKAFKPGVKIQSKPILMTQFRNIVQIAGGKEHMIMLDKFGDVYSWGIGTSFQLGHAVNSRLRTKTFGPSKIVGLKNIRFVASGEYHSFAIDDNNKLWAWGLNNFSQTGIRNEVDAGAMIEKPTLVEFFADKEVKSVDGGNHHSVILLEDGSIYTVGEITFHQIGVPKSQLPPETVYEPNSGAPAYVPVPFKLTVGKFEEEEVPLPKMKFVACGTEHSIALSEEDGSTWTWGFGEVYQLGHGKQPGEDDPEDEEVPTRIKNTATTGVNMVWGAAGGRFSVIAGNPAEE